MSPTPLHYIAPRELAAVLDLPRLQLAARIHTLRTALDDLRGLEQLDGAMPYDCIGSMKKALIALEMELFRRDHPAQPVPESEPPMPLPVALAAVTQSAAGFYAPTEKQVAYYRQLADSPVFTEEERWRLLDWLVSKASRQTIKDQIDWLKHQVEDRGAVGRAS